MKTLLLLVLAFTGTSLYATEWTKDQLMSPAQLAEMLENKSPNTPLILNIGPMEDIKSAVNVGSPKTEAGKTALAKELLGIPKDKPIVIYCGCCTLESCPNISLAYDLVKSSGYSSVKVLNLPTGILEDWKAKGYPMW